VFEATEEKLYLPFAESLRDCSWKFKVSENSNNKRI
jgi:hypothetical protein